MKKYLCLLLLFSISSVALSETIDVDIKPTFPNSKPTRSVIPNPKVKIDNETFVLSIMVNVPNESFAVYVFDERGNVVYQDNVIADGANYQYLLPNLDSGNYSISIETERIAFGGEFNL